MTSKKSQADLTTAYARAVIAGEIVAGRLVRLACERHLRDLETAAARGLRWDLEAANFAIKFFSFLRLPKDGEIDGQPFMLAPFQQFIIGSLFGWKGADGYRRFRTAYIETAKGSGKTPLAAGIGLFGLVMDGEAAAEIYCAATTRDQAGMLFRDAKRMAEASRSLRSRLDIGLHNVAYHDKHSFLRPCSSEHHGLDGKRVHMALLDEIHEHPTPLVVDKMRAGTKARTQALIIEITNAGHDRTTVCWAHHEYSVKVLEGVLEDDSWFAFVCALDPCDACRLEGQTQPKDGCKDCDDWRNEAVWEKVNPNLNVTPGLKYLREQVREAMGMPTKEGIVKRLNFCIWTQGETRAIPMDRWDACKRQIDWKQFEGRECFAALDIGSTSDFCCLDLLFPHDDGELVEIPLDAEKPDGEKLSFTRRSYTQMPVFWLPEQSVKRDHRIQGIIDHWKKLGLIRVTGGDVVDYGRVLLDILALDRVYGIRKIAVDRGWQGAQICTDLMAHLGAERVVMFVQGIVSMAAPFREYLELVKLGRLHHDGNQVLRWMASNCVAEERNGLSKPSKDKSTEKIDGITAGVMGVGLASAEAPAVEVTVDVW